MMKTTPTIFSLTFIHLLLFSCSSATSPHQHDDFLECISTMSDVVYTPINSSFISILRSSIKNPRFASESTPKPQAIITPEYESQIPPIILCAKKSKLEIRTRSGGHDYEGLSYVSQVPFVIIDLINLSEVTVDVEAKTAWVGAGATISSLYYRIAEKSPILGFPGGGCLTLGVGGHFSGGGDGTMLRKFGMAADHIIDARIIDANGRILDRESMGEDLFWAIRGGGGASFGVIVAWKVELVDVPERVTVFTIGRSLEQNATQLVHRWQIIAPKIDPDLFIGVQVYRVASSNPEEENTIARVVFFSVFLGRVERLLSLMQESFPELGLVREDCTEASWIESVVYIGGFPIQTPLEILLNRTQPDVRRFKAKSDYVQEPIPEYGLQGIWRLFDEAKSVQGAVIVMVPYGGRMADVSESAIPFPHRAGNLYKFTQYIFWEESEAQNSDSYISWSRRLYDYMTPYVSKSPRAAYFNYRDLDLGVNNVKGRTSYAKATIWGFKYFKNNFDRLVRVKTLVDPENFFKNEQSIPPLHSKAESAHAKLKKYLGSSQGDFESSWKIVNSLIELQHTEIKASFQQSLNVVEHSFRPQLFRELRGLVSRKALNMILIESNRANHVGVDTTLCGCVIRNTHELPCAHEIAECLRDLHPISISSVNPHWLKLDLKISQVSYDSFEVNIDDEINTIWSRFHASNQVGKLAMKRKLQELGNPATTFLVPPLQKCKTKGRPSSKDIKSTRREPSYFEIVESTTSKCEAELYEKTSRVKRQEKIPVRRPTRTMHLLDALPFYIKPYVHSILDVKADGHCGFRAVASLLGFGEDSWLKVREDLVAELCKHRKYYVDFYGSTGLVATLLESLSCTTTPAPHKNWMTLPDMGHLIATTYNVVFILVSKMQSFTHPPLRTSPPPSPQHKVITIGFINGNHFVQVNLNHVAPIPPIVPNWKYKRCESAVGWDTPYLGRIRAFRALIPQHMDSNQGGIICL